MWRFHTAVSTRVSALHSCVDSDRRWPPSSLCPSCWQPSDQSALWEVLSEAKAKTKDGESLPMSIGASEQVKKEVGPSTSVGPVNSQRLLQGDHFLGVACWLWQVCSVARHWSMTSKRDQGPRTSKTPKVSRVRGP